MNINSLKIGAISIGLLMGSVLPSFASNTYQLQDYNSRVSSNTEIASNHGFLLGANVDYNLVNASMENSIRERGYYGFGVSGGYQWQVVPSSIMGLVFSYHQNSNSTFTIDGGEINTTLNMINAELQYHYHIDNDFRLGLIGGASYVFGETDIKNINLSDIKYSRIEPLVGAEFGYYISPKIHVDLGYRHYFGVHQYNAYQGSDEAPTIDQLSLGFTYDF